MQKTNRLLLRPFPHSQLTPVGKLCPFTHGQASGAESLTYYKKALALDPHNLAAFHYAIHAYENLGNIQEALARSADYARLAYAIPHAHHMHGHELMRMGRTEEAIQEFLKTNELEETYYRTENIPPQYDWHHAHNLMLLAMAYQSLGQMKAAEARLREAYSLPAYTDLAEFNRRAWPEFLLARGQNVVSRNAHPHQWSHFIGRSALEVADDSQCRKRPREKVRVGNRVRHACVYERR